MIPFQGCPRQFCHNLSLTPRGRIDFHGFFYVRYEWTTWSPGTTGFPARSPTRTGPNVGRNDSQVYPRQWYATVDSRWQPSNDAKFLPFCEFLWIGMRGKVRGVRFRHLIFRWPMQAGSGSPPGDGNASLRLLTPSSGKKVLYHSCLCSITYIVLATNIVLNIKQSLSKYESPSHCSSAAMLSGCSASRGQHSGRPAGTSSHRPTRNVSKVK